MCSLHHFRSAFVVIAIALCSLAGAAAQTADTVSDNATGIRLAIPGMLRGPSASKFGSLWTGANDGLQVDTLKLTNKTLNDLFDTIKKVSGRRVIKESRAADGFEIEGVDRDQTAFYMKAEDRSGEVRAVSITYRSQYEKDARAIAASAQLFPSGKALPAMQPVGGAPLSSQPEPSISPIPVAAKTADKVTTDFPIQVVPPTMHSGGINSLTMSGGEERFVVSSGDDGVLKLWDVPTGRLIRNVARVDQENKYWRVLSLSNDGRRLLGVVASDSKVWDTITGKELLSFPNEDDSSAIIARSGKRVVLKRKNNSIQVFDPSLGKAIWTLKDATELAFSPDADRAIAGGSDRSVYFVDAMTGKRGAAVTTLDAPASSISFAADGNIVAIQSASTFTLWNLKESKALAQLSGGSDAEFMFSTDGAYIAFDDGNGKVTILDSQTGAMRTSFALPADSQIATFLNNNAELIFAPKSDSKVKWSMISVSTSDGKTLRTVDGEPADVNNFSSRYYVDDQDDGLHLRDLTDWKDVRRLGGQLSLGAATFSASGSKYVISEKGQAKLLDSQTGQILAKCPADADDIIVVAISSKEQWIASGGAGKSVNICDVATSTTIKTFEGHNDNINSLAFSPDDRQILSGDSNGEVRLWDIATGKLLRTFKGNERNALVVSFSPDGRRLFAGTDDNKVRIWDASSGKELHTLRMLIGPVHAMTVSPDGKRVAAGPYGELTMKQWDVETGKELKRLESGLGGRFTTTNDAEYSSDGKSLIAIANNRIEVWDVNTGQKRLELNAPDQELKAISFSKDQSRIVSLDEAGVIRHWNRTTGALLVTIVVFGDGQWLRVTPEGFFDASSPEAAKYLSVVRGLEVYSIDQFYNQLYRPDLVREKLAGDPQGKARDAAARLDLTKAVASGSAPRVVMTTPLTGTKVQGEQLNAEAEVIDQGGGIGKIEWRVNGVTLGIEDRGFKRVDQATTPAGPKSMKIDRALALAPGENRIAVLAYNEAGLIASVPAEITVTSVQEASQKPNLYVLAVGVNNYWDGALRLNFAKADATSLGDGLKQAGGKLYQEIIVKTVLDAEATAEKLDAVFAELGQKVRPQDVFVFFLAGHGKTVDARFYFLPQDFRYSGEDSIVKKGVGQDQLQSWVSRIKAQKSVLLFDACQSGSLIGERIAMRGIEEKAAIDRMTRAMGRTILTATTDDKPAFEGYRGHGVFTYTLLAGLDEADSDGNGVIDVTELAQYVDRRLPDLTYDVFNVRQVPQMSIAGSNFPLASRASVLSGDGKQAAPADIPTRPTHVVIAPADVKSEASPSAATLSQLGAGTQVYLMRSENGWMLIARDGQRLGYVKESALIKLQ